MNKEQVSATGSKNTGWDVRVDTGKRDPGRENPRGHLTQYPHHSLPHAHGNEKACSITSDCPFQIPRMKHYESAIVLGTQEKPSQTMVECWLRSQETYLFPGSAKAGLA